MQIISVVRNFDMYNKLVFNNQFYGDDANFACFDNNKENKYISVRYNEFLKNYDYSKEDWFVFCHEDWELKENLELRLKNLDKNFLYGPIGMSCGRWFNSPVLLGSIEQSDKNGANIFKLGTDEQSTDVVGVFDCQCLIVHSSLVQKYDLKFDENLSFDLYVEDFCINAREKHDVFSKILSLKCQHYSHGTVGDRFYVQLNYLRNKYKKVKRVYWTTVKGEVISGFNSIFLNRCVVFAKKYFRFLYQNKKTSSGKRIVKICRIPVYYK